MQKQTRQNSMGLANLPSIRKMLVQLPWDMFFILLWPGKVLASFLEHFWQPCKQPFSLETASKVFTYLGSIAFIFWIWPKWRQHIAKSAGRAAASLDHPIHCRSSNWLGSPGTDPETTVLALALFSVIDSSMEPNLIGYTLLWHLPIHCVLCD